MSLRCNAVTIFCSRESCWSALACRSYPLPFYLAQLQARCEISRVGSYQGRCWDKSDCARWLFWWEGSSLSQPVPEKTYRFAHELPNCARDRIAPEVPAARMRDAQKKPEMRLLQGRQRRAREPPPPPRQRGRVRRVPGNYADLKVVSAGTLEQTSIVQVHGVAQEECAVNQVKK